MRTMRKPLEDEQFIDEDIYCESSREALLEDDALTAIEEAFMRGWDDA